MFERYLPGLSGVSQMSDEDFVRKYKMLLYMLKTEGVDTLKIKQALG